MDSNKTRGASSQLASRSSLRNKIRRLAGDQDKWPCLLFCLDLVIWVKLQDILEVFIKQFPEFSFFTIPEF